MLIALTAILLIGAFKNQRLKKLKKKTKRLFHWFQNIHFESNISKCHLISWLNSSTELNYSNYEWK